MKSLFSPHKDSIKTVTFEEKRSFTDKVDKLNVKELRELVKMVNKLAPQALTDLDEMRIQIKIDDLPHEAFYKGLEYMNAAIEERLEIPKKVKR